jgi:hypothetical protein
LKAAPARGSVKVAGINPGKRLENMMSDTTPENTPENTPAGLSEPGSVNNGSATPESPDVNGTTSETESYEIADPETSLSSIYATDAEANQAQVDQPNAD